MTERTYILRTPEIMSNCLRYMTALRPDEDRPMQVTVKPYKKRRSVAQNALYWQMLTIIAQEGFRLGITKDPDTDEPKYFPPEVIHEYMKRKFLGKRVVVCDDLLLLPESSANKSTVVFSEFIDQIDAWAAEHGIIVPDMHQEL